MQKIGFIGLGVMGKPMAGHLVDAGYSLWLHTRSGVPDELLGQQTAVCDSPCEVAQQAEVIFLMLPDTSDVEAVLFGENGLYASLRPGTIVVDMSTISPTKTREFAKRVEAVSCSYLDAPVSGGDVGAREGSLSIMVGGSQATFASVKPLLELMGSRITYIGEVGAGQACKAANQIVVAMNIQAVAEALTFARRMGVDPVRVREALLGGFAGSRVLEVHGQRMLSDNFAPGFKLGLHLKDLGLVMDSAEALELCLPGTSLVKEQMQALCQQGADALDSSAIVRAL